MMLHKCTIDSASMSQSWTSKEMRAWRKRMGWTQAEAGTALGFSRTGYLTKEGRGNDLAVTLAMKYLENHHALCGLRDLLQNL